MPPADVPALPFPLFRRGKVRDVYNLDGDRLLIVATDRLSAFDVVLPTPIPGKGELLTAISNHWFNLTSGFVANHRTGEGVDSLGLADDLLPAVADRATIVRKAERIDIECVVRGNLAGTGWKEYQQRGTLAGEPLPSGLKRGDALPKVQFTPAIKNDSGHDENISRADLANRIGAELANRLEATSMEIFQFARDIAARSGFNISDTKFEFGWIDGQIVLIDELLTPDSSRYWDVATWEIGTEPPSYDKQVVRDWLEASGWNKEPPGPELPPEVVAITRERYANVLGRLTEKEAR